MNSQEPITTTDESRQRQNGLWSAGIFTLLGLAFLIYNIYLVYVRQGGEFEYSNIFLMPVAVLIFLAGIFSFVQFRRNRNVQATNLLYYFAVLIPPVIAVLFLADVGTVAILYILLLSSILVALVVPQPLRRTAITAAVMAVLFVLVLEFLAPRYRQISNLAGFTNIALALAALIILILIIRQTITGNILTKLATAFIVLLIIGIGIVGTADQSAYRIGLTEDVGDKLSKLATAHGHQIATSLDREMTALTTLSLSKTIQSAARTANQTSNVLTQAEINELDAQWMAADAANNNADPLVSKIIYSPTSEELRGFRHHALQHVEIFMTGVQGFNVAATNRTSDYNQADEEWWQKTFTDGKYIGQPELDASSNTVAINMAVAIREFGDGRIIGVLRTTVDLTALVNTLAAGAIGETGKTLILLPSGKSISLGVNESGASVLVEEDTPSDLLSLSPGTSTYQNVVVNGVPMLASEANVEAISSSESEARLITNLHWRVVTIQESAEALAAVDAQARSSLILDGIVLLMGIIGAFFVARLISNPIVQLTSVAKTIADGDLTARAKVTSRDEVGTLANTFNSMTQQLRNFISTLESRVLERTKSLELATEVGRSVSQVRDLDVMLREAVEIIRSRFDMYYVQVYLVNPTQNALLLKAGTGKVGEDLVSRGHQLTLDTSSINGRAAMERTPVVITDTTASPTFRPNALLPETRSEMAVPLIFGSQVVGVLDIQSSQAGSLDKDILPAFEALAGQLAVAIQNANLLEETELARLELEKQARRLVRGGWDEYLDAIHKPEKTTIVFEGNEVRTVDEMQEGEAPISDTALTAPITISGEPIGTLAVEAANKSPQTSELMQAVARQVAQQIENLRLLDSAERYRAEVEQASRRATVEGWKNYVGSRAGSSLGYLYDLNTVRPEPNGQKAKEATVTLPLKARDETVGKLAILGNESPDSYSMELANAVADRLGTHLESLRLFEETKRGQVELDKRARQLAAVAQISTASSRELDLDKMLHTVVHLTQRQFELYHAHIFLFNETTRDLKIAACGWKAGDPHEGTDGTAVISIDHPQSLVAQAGQTRQVVIVNDVHNDPRWLPNPLLPDTRSEMAIPLVIGDQILGVLDVQSEEVNAFSEEDANIQSTLASQVATSLQNARSFALAQEQAKRESMLNAISQKIQSATSVEAVLQIAARELGHALGAPLTIAQLGVKDGKK